MTRQLTRLTAASPSSVAHIVDVEFRGNRMKARTKCGYTPKNLKSWVRIWSIDGFSKCQRCFKEGE